MENLLIVLVVGLLIPEPRIFLKPWQIPEWLLVGLYDRNHHYFNIMGTCFNTEQFHEFMNQI